MVEFTKVGRGSSEGQEDKNLYFFWQEINIEEDIKEAMNIATQSLTEHFNYIRIFPLIF